jgi:hypothetical protein
MNTQTGFVLVFDPAKDDVTTLPEKAVALMEERCHWECEVSDYQRNIKNTTPDQYAKETLEYVKLVRTEADKGRVDEIQDEIKTLRRDIQAGSDAWEEGEDECAMAECDPSDQFCKGMAIEELENELNKLLVTA